MGSDLECEYNKHERIRIILNYSIDSTKSLQTRVQIWSRRDIFQIRASRFCVLIYGDVPLVQIQICLCTFKRIIAKLINYAVIKMICISCYIGLYAQLRISSKTERLSGFYFCASIAFASFSIKISEIVSAICHMFVHAYICPFATTRESCTGFM
jgi:hypothetical protein